MGVLNIPPLRQRPEDILPMVQFVLRSGRGGQEAIPRIALDVADLITQYPWPGNMRELGNAVRYAMAFMPGDEVTLDSLPPRIRTQAQEGVKPGLVAGGGRHAYLRSCLQKQAAAMPDSDGVPA